MINLTKKNFHLLVSVLNAEFYRMKRKMDKKKYFIKIAAHFTLSAFSL